MYIDQVTVETLAGAEAGHGFLINVFSDNSCPGLLVSILEAFDEMGLSLLPATGEVIMHAVPVLIVFSTVMMHIYTH